MREERWSFTTDPDTGVVEMSARLVGDGGLVGDATETILPGTDAVDPPGLTHAALFKAKSGTLVIGPDRKFTIISDGT